MHILLNSNIPRITATVQENLAHECGPHGSYLLQTLEHYPGLLLSNLRSRQCDAIILGIANGDYDSTLLLAEIRKITSVPILILSESSDEEFEVVCFRTGQTYINVIRPPFTSARILAYLEVLLRARTSFEKPETDKILRFGTLELYPRTYMLKFNGKELRLNRKQCAVMEILLTHPKIWHSRDKLLEAWKNVDVFERNVDTCIKVLRRRFQNVFNCGRYDVIETKYKVGYRLSQKL